MKKSCSRSSDKDAPEVRCAHVEKAESDIYDEISPTQDPLEKGVCAIKENTVPTLPSPKTYVFLDLETTGLPEHDRLPQITDYCLLAVHVENLNDVAFNNTPRVIN